MSMHDIVKKRMLENANAQLETKDPSETNVELWKALWKGGIDMECAWNRTSNSEWRRVHKYEENAQGVAFTHGGTKVKFRRKVK